MPVRSYPGGQALTDYSRHRLNDRLRAHGDGQVVGARFLHFADCERALEPAEEKTLAELLDYAPAAAELDSSLSILVVPRLGTISPWSSKATEIIRNCGLMAILRVERGVEYRLQGVDHASPEQAALLHDRMTESILPHPEQCDELFAHLEPTPLDRISLGSEPAQALHTANQAYGLALSEADIEYLIQAYGRLGRDPTDAELMMFAQVNSEHCRHKIFNACWMIDGKSMQNSLFEMIRHTHAVSSDGTLSAYHDNAAVLDAGRGRRLAVDSETRSWNAVDADYGIVIKVETHNHPTGISPFPGAATGSGGEIRDETACGRGGRPKAGLCGFTVSNLNLDTWPRPWEDSSREHPPRMASPLDIMIEGPIGAASFNNEFGRPCLTGYFRTLEGEVLTPAGRKMFGYHKPIMIAGGVGSIRVDHVQKQPIPEGALIVVLGGPAMLIGLGGGAASSQHTGASDEGLDYASVQRSNPEMQRRAQEVIEQCTARGVDNPILSVHDVGAGGLSNAIPELIDGEPGGAGLNLREIPCADSGMSPREIWCNESQERYVLAIREEALDDFAEMCRRERCPFATIGKAAADGQLHLADPRFGEAAADVPLSFLFGESSRMDMTVPSVNWPDVPLDLQGIDLSEAVQRVLTLPSVGSKAFLITIGDRSVGGLTARDQMIGPWQVPVSDAAVTACDFEGTGGEAMAMGERPALAIHRPAASARMAVAEALTNLASVRVCDRTRVRLSANWMAAGSEVESLYGLYEAVEAISLELCPQLGIAIPVGKDSLSMQAAWEDQQVTSPVSLVVSAFAPVEDVRRHATPQLQDNPDSCLLLVSLNSSRRLGGSALAQAYGQTGSDTPDVDDPSRLAAFLDQIQALLDEDAILAYHDRSDGGLLACLCECAFAGHVGLDIDLPVAADDLLSCLFNEEIGAVLQVRSIQAKEIADRFEEAGLICESIGTLNPEPVLRLCCRGEEKSAWPLPELQQLWSRTSYEVARRRDHEECARSEYENGEQWGAPPLFSELSYEIKENPAAPYIHTGVSPTVAILREQGVNGQVEMAAAFSRAGFVCKDLHMNDLQRDPHLLDDVSGLAACGGFSYGDVLGAGGGWAKNILYHKELREIFKNFFERPEVFALGVCNGCQLLSQMKELIPGASHWPRFVSNLSEQFEARLCEVEILESPSILLRNMAGSRLPIVVAHGEGRIDPQCDVMALEESACLRYIDANGAVAEDYPTNPNGSARGITALTNTDGRFTIMMPHPERVFRTLQHSWHPPEWEEDAPWLRLFQNARAWVGEKG